ncbi:MAG: translation initiation factor IF-2, partial [Candidatus Omnitrophota bacterium]
KPLVKEYISEPKKEVPPIVSAVVVTKPEIILKELELTLPITVKDLAIRLQEKPSILIKFLMGMRMMVGINQLLDENITGTICEKYGFKIKKASADDEIALALHEEADDPKNMLPRPAIVTFMGHVDHGKTSLLDAIRKTKVAEDEHGGITQHIGAYRVKLPHGEITFLDTPGHEAFTAMRARGASVTDIVVLVVAADDGIMPQTQEAIDHARAAGVTIIVAINKIDKAQAEPDRVKKQLAELGLTPEDWGGKTITVPVSAKTGQGIDNLLEMILLEAEVLELKANPKRQAKGVVIEAKMSKGRGPVSTLLVRNGTLKLNENIIVGKFYGKIRAMSNHHGQAILEASPSCPVEVLGISGIPEAGEQFFVIADEALAKEMAGKRHENHRQSEIKIIKRISLEDLHAQIQAGKIQELKIILKSDVQGSLEAIKDTILKLNVSEIKIDIIHNGVGNINTSDIILAVASNALVLGFNIVADNQAKAMAAKEGVDIKIYNIIYELANDIKTAVEGMLAPKLKKVFVGRAEIRKVLRLSRAGTVAGCFVPKGKITRHVNVSLVRNGEVVFEGKISALKRFKDDVKEVGEGFECGISLSGFDAYQEGDIIEAYDVERIARKL